MAFYRSILAVQAYPLDAGPDEARRQTWTINFDADVERVAPSNVLLELAGKITTAGLATLNTDLFIATSRTIPTGDGPYTQILLTGGFPPSRSHGAKANISTYDKVRFQLVVRAKNGLDALTKILAIRDEFDNTFNTTLVAA